jgi:Tfp pilus assembly protein PilV
VSRLACNVRCGCFILSANHFDNEIGVTMTRRGFLLIEMLAAGVLLLALTALCVKYFAVTATQRRTLDQRQTALNEAANIMELLTVRPWSDLTSETLAKISLSPETQLTLSDGELKIDLADEDAKPAAKRITVTIRWQDSNGQWNQPVRLVAWRCQR